VSSPLVKVVDAAEIVPLRHQVLRPHQPRARVTYAEDPTACHLAAYDPTGRLVGCVTVFPDPFPAPIAVDGVHWRLRGMATAADVRGQGYGAALLQSAISAARDRGASLLWCNAREAAVGFYARYGMKVVGEQFDIATVGPHRRMIIEINAGEAPSPRAGSGR
jgi:GNAT superfamily N-acetyltransferase